MHLSYLDESGDPGTLKQKNAQGVSDYFLITNFYLPDSHWKVVFLEIQNFRKRLKEEKEVNFLNIEFHAREFIQARSPYFMAK